MSKLTVTVDGFDLEEFNKQNPIYDPFVERLNERERAESGYCWWCYSEFDRKNGKVIRGADPECFEIVSQQELCPSCRRAQKIPGLCEID